MGTKSDLPLLIVIVGPTAIGKTRTAIALAQIFATEIISADSRQFYRELNIGVARPSPDELSAVPHHLIGFLSITDTYNVSLFETDVLRICGELFSRKDSALLTGGSGLYLHAITHGIDTLPDPDPALRTRLKSLLETEGIGALQKQLRELDPDTYNHIDLQNPKRLLRALEICLAAGLPCSSLRTRRPADRQFRVLKIGLNTTRDKLYEMINSRVEVMMANGLLDEARLLFPAKGLNALNTVGYKELFACFEGKYTLDEAAEKIRINTRRYAKRQLTWFRRDPEIRWFEPERITEMEAWIRSFA